VQYPFEHIKREIIWGIKKMGIDGGGKQKCKELDRKGSGEKGKKGGVGGSRVKRSGVTGPAKRKGRASG